MKEEETQNVNTSNLTSPYSAEADESNRTSEGLFFETRFSITPCPQPDMMEQLTSFQQQVFFAFLNEG